jgi:hypothetical protein
VQPGEKPGAFSNPMNLSVPYALANAPVGRGMSLIPVVELALLGIGVAVATFEPWHYGGAASLADATLFVRVPREYESRRAVAVTSAFLHTMRV